MASPPSFADTVDEYVKFVTNDPDATLADHWMGQINLANDWPAALAAMKLAWGLLGWGPLPDDNVLVYAYCAKVLGYDWP